MTITYRVFISCVSAEFRSYREDLRCNLTNSWREVKVQEDFPVGGATLLEKLDDYIRRCQALIHLVGDNCGFKPQPAEVRTLLDRYPDFTTTHPELADGLDACSYSQWEAYLAIYHRVPCYIYLADAGSQRETGWTAIAKEQAGQQAHLERLSALGQDRCTLPFADWRDVVLRFQNASSEPKIPAASSAISWPDAPSTWQYDLADREQEFEFFLKFITGQSKEHIYLLGGPSERGKSVLLAQFAEQARKLGLHCGHVEFKGGLSLRDTLNELTRELRPLPFTNFKREYGRDAEQTMRSAFIDDLDEADAPVLIILDTYEQAGEEARQWLEHSFLPHFRRCDNLRLVLAGQTLPPADAGRPWGGYTYSRELPPIHDARHWRDYGNRVIGLTLPDNQFELLVKAVSGSPGALHNMLTTLKAQA